MGQSEWSEPTTTTSFDGSEVAVDDYDVASEAIAYRIEKLASNGDVIQNIYYFNDILWALMLAIMIHKLHQSVLYIQCLRIQNCKRI